MAGDVSCLVRVMNNNNNETTSSPITRDLLGAYGTKELDLDLQVPSGWEKRLDLQSGKVYLQRCCSNSTNSCSSTSETSSSTKSKFQDLNFPPSPKQTLNLFDSSNYQSVCTLDKVKSALQRADDNTRKRSSVSISSSSQPSTSSSSVDQKSSAASIAAACPTCLLYVLISRCNPKCPRCYNQVPLPLPPTKKPRIDLNISI